MKTKKDMSKYRYIYREEPEKTGKKESMKVLIDLTNGSEVSMSRSYSGID